MLRYHMAVLTRDANLRRAVKRLTTATGSTADFPAEAAALATEKTIHLGIYDAREHNPEKAFLKKLQPDAKIVYIVEGDRLVEKLSLFEDERATSLFCHDARFDDDEFISTCTKALRGEVFGLQKYFPWGVTTFSILVKNHSEKDRALGILAEYANLAGVRGAVRERIQTVCDELIMNALYHAPVDESGKEIYAGTPLRELAKLEEVNRIRVMYGCSGQYFGVSVRDGFGSLSRPRLLEYLLRAKNGAKIEEKAGGAGLGLVTVLRSCSKLVFNLDPGHSTEVIALFDMELFAKGKMGARSLHVFKAPPHEAEAEEAPALPAPGSLMPRFSTWIVAALLLAVVAALGTAVAMKRSGGQEAVVEPPAAPTLTVYPEPSDAEVRLGGVAIPAGEPQQLEAGVAATLHVERKGYTPRTINLAPATPGERAVYVTLGKD